MPKQLVSADSVLKIGEFRPWVMRRLKLIPKPVETGMLCSFLALTTSHKNFMLLFASFNTVWSELSLKTLIM
jgi:hypothetical protein